MSLPEWKQSKGELVTWGWVAANRLRRAWSARRQPGIGVRDRRFCLPEFTALLSLAGPCGSRGADISKSELLSVERLQVRGAQKKRVLSLKSGLRIGEEVDKAKIGEVQDGRRATH